MPEITIHVHGKFSSVFRGVRRAYSVITPSLPLSFEQGYRVTPHSCEYARAVLSGHAVEKVCLPKVGFKVKD
jgi:hypothetical protein